MTGWDAQDELTGVADQASRDADESVSQAQVRTRAFLVGTLALVVILGGYLAFITFVGDQSDRVTRGITPNSAALAQPLQASGSALGKEIQVREVEAAAGQQKVPTAIEDPGWMWSALFCREYAVVDRDGQAKSSPGMGGQAGG